MVDGVAHRKTMVKPVVIEADGTVSIPVIIVGIPRKLKMAGMAVTGTLTE